MVNWKTRIRERLLQAGHALDEDIIEELATHAAAAYEAQRADNADLDEAEQHVIGLIDSWLPEAARLRRRTSIRIETPSKSTSVPFAGFLNDLRYALRAVTRRPGFAALTIATMALGIGVTTVLFSMAYSVLLKPLPWPDPDRLVQVTETHQGATRKVSGLMTNAAYLPWKEQPATIEGLAAWSKQQMTLTGRGDTERITVAAATASLFSVLHASPLAGQVFAEADEQLSQGGNVVLSYRIWQARFAGKLNAIGDILILDGRPYTIRGVMPRDFTFPDRETQAWIPLSIPPVVAPDAQTRRAVMFSAIARLRSGVTPRQAAAEATARARSAPDPGLAALAVFGSNGPAEVSAVPVLDALTRNVRPALIALAAAVALLLATGVANTLNLQIANASARLREVAIRSALGAKMRRIALQLCIESLILGVAGGAIGVVSAAAVHWILPSLLPADFPRIDELSLDWRVIVFALLLTLMASIIVGVLPALHLRRISLVEGLLESGTGSATAKRTVSRGRNVIMAGQVAIACVLLIGGMLLSRSFLAMINTDRGYDVSNLMTARLSMPNFAFPAQKRLDVLVAILKQARLIPGVTRAAFTTGLPLSGSETLSAFTMPSRRPPVGAPVQVHTTRSVVNDQYFATIGMRMVEGRAFTDADTAGSPKVVVVNRMFAGLYLSDKPLGEKVSNFATADGVEYEVIGIVDDILKRGIGNPAQPEIYSLDRQMTATTFNPDGASLVIRTAGDPHAMVAAIRRIVLEQDPSISLYSVLTMEDRLSGSLAKPRLYALLFSVFAVSALLVAGIGLFGTLSYTVTQRRREIAVRTAVGAQRIDIVRMVLRQGLILVVVGVATGLLVSIATTRYLSTLLYGVSAYDGWTLLVAPVVIIGAALLACLVPALRAANTDPLIALRSS